MPYRRAPRSQRKHLKPKVSQHILKTFTAEKRSLVKFGIVPESVKNPITHQPLTRKLASSSKQERDVGVAMVGNILSQRSLDKIEMTQLWKALFYSFWMSDKVLIQQELARKLANFIKVCDNDTTSLLYIECFFECMEREWSGIDYLRMDKFLSLVRYFIHCSFDYFALNEWKLSLIEQFSNILRYKINLLNSTNRGLFLHLNDVYIEELIKICRIDGDDHLSKSFRPTLTFDALYNLLTPFITIYLESNQLYQQQYVIQKIFQKLMESMSFDKQQRETNLTQPGYDNLDLYQYNIHKKTKNLNKINSFIDDEENEKEEEDQDVDVTKIPSNQIKNFHDEKMKKIDPNSWIRRKKNETHIMFDKKNFDVVMPYKEMEKDEDRQRVKQWKIKYKESVDKREHDPLLIKDKMEQFHKVFDYLANHEKTPNKARKKLKVLSNVFVQRKLNNHGLNYNRYYIKKAVKMVDNRQKIKRQERNKKEKKRTMRRIMKHQRKWRKMGIKGKPSKKFIKRASKIVV